MDRALTPEMLDGSPMKQFTHWFDEAVAAGLPEPNAMVFTTLGPHARTVLLKAHDDTGFTFYTNRTSRKGRDLAADPRCCALFPWYALGRQVTVEGAVRQLSTAESEPYYHSRPWLSQIGAWASRQSTVLASRAELDDRVAELAARWPEGTEVPMPDFWGGYVIVPERIEFWQSRTNRLHDRLSYRRSGMDWVIERLSPLRLCSSGSARSLPRGHRGDGGRPPGDSRFARPIRWRFLPSGARTGGVAPREIIESEGRFT